MHSYHIFYFPFKWEIPNKKDKLFSEQVDLDDIKIVPESEWERVQIPDKIDTSIVDDRVRKDYEAIFGEKNYYFEFVHPALYDEQSRPNSILHHYERKETKEIAHLPQYIIKTKGKSYVLQIDAMNLNLYATGVGVISFFLKNEYDNQKDPDDIRIINQFGRRIMPPHYGEITCGPDKRGLISEEISIIGLRGIDEYYKEDFNAERYGLSDVWKPAKFICQLVKDLSVDLKVIPVIDDRMFVNCWYGNDKLSEQFKASEKENDLIKQSVLDLEDKERLEKFVEGDFWYKYLFVDEGSDETCQNNKMKTELLEKCTYYRWQKYGTLYGVSRYSVMLLTDMGWFSKNIVSVHMRTIYSRMVELMLVQRASMLRFSDEVTKVSCLSDANKMTIPHKISSLYKEYIRFVNQIFFREVTAQDQGIELYHIMMSQFDSEKQITDLDDEISELHDYASLLADQKRNDNGQLLNVLAAIFLPATILTGLFGMNPFSGDFCLGDFIFQIGAIVSISLIVLLIIRRKIYEKK
ncbi:MAG: CorA family divalent cation transporter [Tannerella sp.]|jgi:Mg2+ and Co2+ transporter CorA|nr:CorA family divalent cation transporter [Tannerella sp.]